MKIFVSYTLRDGQIDKNYLEKLYKYLQNQGDTFIDLLHNNSIDPQKRIEEELKKSDLLLLIKTKLTDQSEWVELETKKATSLGIKILTFSKEEALSAHLSDYQHIEYDE